ncbi:MAG: DOMON-like domain-containing protein [Burkholderiales bacterium]|nr:DOMON-like domain-containing protein [Burkholderiales bacterium]
MPQVLHNAGAMTSSHLLTCHPLHPSLAVRSIVVRVTIGRSARLALSFALEGEIARLRIPAARAPQMTEKLWQHTCFEAFVGMAGELAYHEFNFAPSGEWMTYAFRDYRVVATLPDASFSPEITVRRGAEKLELDAVVHLDRLSFPADAQLRLGLSAVVEDDKGALSYWALQHPPGKPDFHHSAAFTIEL